MYLVPKEDQFHDTKLFLFNLSNRPLKIPYSVFISMDFVSLNYIPRNVLLQIAKKLELNPSETLIEDIKASIQFD